MIGLGLGKSLEIGIRLGMEIGFGIGIGLALTQTSAFFNHISRFRPYSTLGCILADTQDTCAYCSDTLTEPVSFRKHWTSSFYTISDSKSICILNFYLILIHLKEKLCYNQTVLFLSISNQSFIYNSTAQPSYSYFVRLMVYKISNNPDSSYEYT